jgi:hypothetical protein
LNFEATVLEVLHDGNNNDIYTLVMNSKTPGRDPQVYYNCTPDSMTKITSSIPQSNYPPPTDDTSQSTKSVPHSPLPSSNWTSQPLADTEYNHPPDSAKKRISTYQMMKHAKDWNIKLRKEEDIKRMYNRLRNYFGYYNIPLKTWSDITRGEDLVTITPHNCMNYIQARRTMSTAIYDYFDQFQDNLFETYSDPQSALDINAMKLMFMLFYVLLHCWS